MQARLPILLAIALICLTACSEDLQGNPPTDDGEPPANNAPDDDRPEGYTGPLPVGPIIDLSVGTGQLETKDTGVLQANFTPLSDGASVPLACDAGGCTLDLLARVEVGAAEGTSWELDFINEAGEVSAFQQGITIWRSVEDGFDYQGIEFFTTQESFEADLAGAGQMEMRLTATRSEGGDELVGFFKVQVNYTR